MFSIKLATRKIYFYLFFWGLLLNLNQCFVLEKTTQGKASLFAFLIGIFLLYLSLYFFRSYLFQKKRAPIFRFLVGFFLGIGIFLA